MFSSIGYLTSLALFSWVQGNDLLDVFPYWNQLCSPVLSGCKTSWKIVYAYIYIYVYTAWPAYVTSVMICFVLSCSTELHNWFQYTDTRPEGHWPLLMDTRDLKSKTSKDILFKRTLSQDRIIILVYILSFIPLMNTDRICFSTTYFILFYYITLYIPVKSSNIIYIKFNVDYSIFRTIIF